MAKTRAEIFAEAQASREAQKADEANRGSSGGSFPSVAFTPITVDPQKTNAIAIRLLGAPYTHREVGTDHKVIYHNWIIGAGGKRYPFIFPTVTDVNKAVVLDPDYILTKFIRAVMSGKWDPDKMGSNGKPGAMVYDHVNTDIFKTVFFNSDPGARYPSGWRPSATILMNCINRAKMDWHRSEKKTLVLSKHYAPNKKDPSKGGFFEQGVSVMAYNAVYDDVVRYDGDYEEYDVIVERMPDVPYYKAYPGIKEGYKFADRGLDKLIVEGSLTEEERSWTMWDFDEFYPTTSYKALYGHLGHFFKQGDALLGTTFFEELQALVADEQANAPAKAPAQKPAPQVPQPSVQTHTSRPAPTPSPAPQAQTPAPVRRPAPVAPAPIDWAGLYDGTFNGTMYLGVVHMTDDDKACVEAVNPDGSFKYVASHNGVVLDPNVNLYVGGSKDFVAPEWFIYDPLTGEKLQ